MPNAQCLTTRSPRYIWLVSDEIRRFAVQRYISETRKTSSVINTIETEPPELYVRIHLARPGAQSDSRLAG